MNDKIASDLDGVICNIPPYLRIDDLGYKLFDSYWGWLRKRKMGQTIFSKLCIPRNVDIITGRPESDRWYTERWLSKNNVDYNNLIMNNLGTMDDHTIANWKADFLIDNRYKKYYDDNFLVLKYLSDKRIIEFEKHIGNNIIYEVIIYGL